MTTPLQLDAVHVTYRGPGRRDSRVMAVKGVSFRLQPGRIVGLAGPNGAGKTSLLEVCTGALRPTEGEVRWFGAPKLDASARRRIGFCPDVPYFPQRTTAAEALRLCASLDGVTPTDAWRQIQRLAERLRLTDMLDRRVESLSRGTAQRLGVLQALIQPRDLLLCDESFGPLDPVAQVDLRELLREEADRGAAILVSSHQLDQLSRFADAVIILRRGEIVREVDASALGPRRHLVMGTEGADAARVEQVIRQFPGSWRMGSHLWIPWDLAEVSESDLVRAHPAFGRPLTFIRFADASLEDTFMAAVGSG